MGLKPVEWMGTSLKDLRKFPEPVQRECGYALDSVQRGDVPPNAKPMKGFMGVTVMEIVERYNTDTYRAVYTTKLEGVVYVLHCFQKKSKRGISTPKPDKDAIVRGLKEAREIHRKNTTERNS